MSASLEIVLPTTFVTAKVLAPTSLAALSTAKVSAVSPDWLTEIINALSVINGALSLNSEAISTSTGIFACFYLTTFPINPAW